MWSWTIYGNYFQYIHMRQVFWRQHAASFMAPTYTPSHNRDVTIRHSNTMKHHFDCRTVLFCYWFFHWLSYISPIVVISFDQSGAAIDKKECWVPGQTHFKLILHNHHQWHGYANIMNIIRTFQVMPTWSMANLPGQGIHWCTKGPKLIWREAEKNK